MKALIIRKSELGDNLVFGPMNANAARGVEGDLVIVLGSNEDLKQPEVAVFEACVARHTNRKSRVVSLADVLGLEGKVKHFFNR